MIMTEARRNAARPTPHVKGSAWAEVDHIFLDDRKPRSVAYKNRGSALDEGYLDELCTTGRDDDE